MADATVHPSRLSGELHVPSSKSQTLRAILFGALAHGTSQIEEPLDSPDTDAMIEAMRLFGATVTREKNGLRIRGVAGQLRTPDDVIHCGNSGIVLRFAGALGGLLSHHTVFTGDASIRHRRPSKPLLDALVELGAVAVSTRGDGFAPLVIRGPFTRRHARVDGRDSQPVSALLIAGAFAPDGLELTVEHPGETAWIDLTLDWLKRLGIVCEHNGAYTKYRLAGASRIDAFHYAAPGDLSTAAFPLVAALLTHSEITLRNVDLTDLQADRQLIPILKALGASIAVDAAKQTLTVLRGGHLRGGRIDVAGCIDALPILAVLGTFAEGRTEIVGGQGARHKESDRIASMAKELRKMGATLEERPDGLVIHQSELRGACLETHADHRLVLALAVAALRAEGASTLKGVEWAAKTYAHWQNDFRALGARIE